MSLPEISRRCQWCGAAMRAGARFCHQCGKGPGAEATASVAPAVEEPPRVKGQPSTGEWAPPTKESAVFEPAPAAPATVGAIADEVGPEESADEETGRAGDLRGRVARVREGTKARVGRMREEAIVVLEETPDDSGLRFVLVAALLFILSLVLLFLSTTLLR